MIYCISDVHAADRGTRDNFNVKGREIRFYDFLKWVEQQQAKLYILGDLFDWWQVNFSSSINQYHGLLDKLDAMQSTYVLGNHDNTLMNFVYIDNNIIEMPHPFFKRMSKPFVQTIGGRKFAFLHGHEFDPYCNKNNPGIGEIATIIAGMLEDLSNGPFIGNLSVEDELKSIGSNSRLCDNIQAIEKYRQNNNIDVVIYGHTHTPGNIGNYHYNSGTWARQIDTFTKIDDEGQVSLWQWKEGVGPVLFEKTLTTTKSSFETADSKDVFDNGYTDEIIKKYLSDIYNKTAAINTIYDNKMEEINIKRLTIPEVS
jgi:UDP-2,3-diacylglucosamine pyrophosphatase LpxH